MLIASIQFNNFRQFKHSNKIVFSQDENKNISVFLGHNTTGKTTILQAFLWCFYNRTSFSKKDEELYNFEVARDAKIRDTIPVSVTIEIFHNDKKYTLQRSIRYVKYEKGISRVGPTIRLVTETDELGITRNLKEPEADILMDQILPESLSQFFFIENEKLTNIRQKSDIKQSLETILGLNALKEAIKDYGSEGITTGYTVLAMLNKEMTRNLPKNAESIKNNLDNVEKQLIEVGHNIEETEKEKKEYETDQQNIKEKLESLDDQHKEKDRKTKITVQIEKYEHDLETQKQQLKGLLRSVFGMVSLGPLNKACDKLENNCKDNSEVPTYELTFAGLEKILSTHRCICGRELCYNDRILVDAKEAMKNREEYDRNFRIKILLDSLQSAIPDNQNIAIEIHDTTRKYFKIQNDIRIEKERLSKISLTESDDNNISYYLEELDILSKRIDQSKSTLNNLYRTKQKLEQDRKLLVAQIEEMNKKLAKNKELSRQLDYAKAVLKDLKSSYENRTTTLVKDLQDEVNSIFTRIYTGDRLIKIDDQYNISSYSEALGESKPIDESGGLTTIVCLSFIGGLLSLAKKKIMRDASYLSEDETVESKYPLVLDAPFSKTDEAHMENIVSTLPDIAEQLIIFVMDKDFDISLAHCKDKVGKIYRLNKHTETYTTIEPEKENY